MAKYNKRKIYVKVIDMNDLYIDGNVDIHHLTSKVRQRKFQNLLHRIVKKLKKGKVKTPYKNDARILL